ncbi:MAG: DUF4235 domain-containing protein [Bifidobacteriaceae bacterium]|jgi:hypothetical protein|nr:DUF4235 domain-containing protein [Bifidobacteriaceae bacterium]
MKLTKWLYTTVATLVAGFVATQVVTLVWRTISGKPAPSDVEDMAESTAAVTVFAALVAATVAVAQTLAGRKALTLLARRAPED